MTARACITGLLVLGVTSILAGCGAPPTVAQAPQKSNSSFHVTAPPPDPSTAAGVAVLALTRIFTWYPATEPPGKSLARAHRWLGPRLRTLVDHPVPGVQDPNPSLQWSDWAARKAIIEAFAFVSGEQAPDNGGNSSGTAMPVVPGAAADTIVFRRMLCKVGIEQTVVYPGGRSERLPPTTVIADVVLTPDGWLLDDYR